MLRKKFSYILSVLLLAVLVAWFMFLYYPKSSELNNVQLQIKEMRHNLASANKANFDIENMEKKLLDGNQRLEEVKARFVEKEDLTKVSKKLEGFARDYDLRLVDFAPVFEDYFVDTSKTVIKALPLAVTVRGNYLDIGRFVENWGKLPFYLEADGIALQRAKPTSNNLEATISSKLYSWNH